MRINRDLYGALLRFIQHVSRNQCGYEQLIGVYTEHRYDRYDTSLVTSMVLLASITHGSYITYRIRVMRVDYCYGSYRTTVSVTQLLILVSMICCAEDVLVHVSTTLVYIFNDARTHTRVVRTYGYIYLCLYVKTTIVQARVWIN